MTYEELKEINFGVPSKALLHKALMECEGMILHYKEQMKKDGKNYWKGKISRQSKQIKLLKDKLK